MVNYVVALGKNVVEDCSTTKITATVCNDRAISLPLKLLLGRRRSGLQPLAGSCHLQNDFGV